jgi:transglutaminase-like putative cysteine protease
MRVRLPDGRLPAEREPFLRWRGVTLDRFDGRVWTATPRRQMVLRAADGIPVGLGRMDRRVPMVTQEVFLEPIGTDTIFALSPPVRITVDGTVRVDDTGSLSVPAARARLTYRAESALGARVVERLGPVARARYLQLPPLPPRIPELARRVTAGAATPAQQAERLTVWLSRALRYSLDLERRTTLEPLEEFLFERRAGNCEYFAAALAVMLRTLGVPARVVNGFQRGEWNPYGEYWVVRMRDAHSWVEANIDATWVTLDPSPRGAAPTAPISTLSLYIDGLRMRWYRYVVGWSRQDQLEAAGAVRRLAWSWPITPRLAGAGSTGQVAVTLLVALAAVAALVGGVRHARGVRRAPGAAMPDFYARALRRLARRGLRPAPSETAREFCARVGAGAPPLAAPFARLTTAYESVRFGPERPGPAESRELTELATRL